MLGEEREEAAEDLGARVAASLLEVAQVREVIGQRTISLHICQEREALLPDRGKELTDGLQVDLVGVIVDRMGVEPVDTANRPARRGCSPCHFPH